MNQQAIFDRVCNHLLTQKQPAKTGEDCSYRTADGMMCAVGCLIEPEHYGEHLEGNSVVKPHVILAVELSLGESLSLDDIKLLSHLQYIHDNDSPDVWPASLYRLAADLDLTYHGDQYGK